jgi:predicted dehydrogenase
VGIVDANAARAAKVAAEFGTRVIPDENALIAEHVDAVCVAVPTREHARVGCRLLEAGMDVLVEKPMAASLDEADALIASAKRHERILQVGHVERFNPAVVAVRPIVSRPMFFEVHRLGVFSPRSLDVDVVYDVMIHDLDILLSLVNAPVTDLKAVGIPVMTDKVDIAQARIEFATGTVANLTASRVSTERVRKMRFFQEHEYISLDFTRQDVLRVRVKQSAGKFSALLPDDGQPEINFEKLQTTAGEPLRAELSAFAASVRTRQQPTVDGDAGRRALELADRVMAGILEHARRVQLGAFSPQEVQ